jgi:hypothetical protein
MRTSLAKRRLYPAAADHDHGPVAGRVHFLRGAPGVENMIFSAACQSR